MEWSLNKTFGSLLHLCFEFLILTQAIYIITVVTASTRVLQQNYRLKAFLSIENFYSPIPGALFDCHISCSFPRWLQIFCWGKNSMISLSLRGKPLLNSPYHNKTCSLPWKARNHKSAILVVILCGIMFRCRCTICDLSPKLPLVAFCVAIMEAFVSSEKFSLILKLVNQSKKT